MMFSEHCRVTVELVSVLCVDRIAETTWGSAAFSRIPIECAQPKELQNNNVAWNCF